MKKLDLNQEDYKKTGIKTLRTLGLISLFLGVIGAFCFIPEWITTENYTEELNPLGIFYSLLCLFSGSLSQAFCYAIATIAEGQLYQRKHHHQVLQEKYNKEDLKNDPETNV